MPRAPIPTWCFALVVARHEGRFLLVQERKHEQLWYVPAGRVEIGETFAEGAIRETFEESGVRVVLEGILRIEHTPMQGGARLRVIFVAHPAADPTTKPEPDEHSLGAGWFTIAEARELPLRGTDVIDLFEAVDAGAPIYPRSLLTFERL